MNFRKVFTSLILSVATLATFACQYSGNPDMNANTRQYKRCIYLAGINSTDNHIAGVTYNSTEEGTMEVDGVQRSYTSQSASYTAYNHMVVYLPLTVYVGVFDLCGGANSIYPRTTAGSGAELQGITLTVQYRVLPESTWHTAMTKFYSSGDLAIMSRKKLFGSAQIDCAATTGSTVLIRLYVAVYSYRQLDDNGHVLATASFVENADLASPSVTSGSDISATEDSLFALSVGGYGGIVNNMSYYQSNELSPDVHFARRSDSNQIVTYLDGWTPQFVMAVKIGDKRRPGK